MARHPEIQYCISNDIVWSQKSHSRIINANFQNSKINISSRSYLPVPDAEHNFLQIYLMGEEYAQADQGCDVFPVTKRHIIPTFQMFSISTYNTFIYCLFIDDV